MKMKYTDECFCRPDEFVGLFSGGKIETCSMGWAKAAVDRRETRRGLTAAKNSWDIFRSALRLFNNRKLSCKTPILINLNFLPLPRFVSLYGGGPEILVSAGSHGVTVIHFIKEPRGCVHCSVDDATWQNTVFFTGLLLKSPILT